MKMLHNFKVGDRVEVTKDSWKMNYLGKKGTVVRVNKDSEMVSVEFDENIGGHGCNGLTKYGYGWNIEYYDLKLVESNREEIIIFRDGLNVTAIKKVDGKTVKSAVAKCNPTDTFDFNTGAKLAFERLTTNVTPKQDFNFKVRCINDARQSHIYTKGKIYDVVDGIFTWDDGSKSIERGYAKFKNIGELNYKLSAKFEEVEEGEEPKIIAQSTYEIGDIVKVKDAGTSKTNCTNCSVFKRDYAGKTVTIVDKKVNGYITNIDATCSLKLGDIEGKVVTENVITPVVKAVKRPANVGETIKIVDRERDEDRYENGDIFTVVSIDVDGDVYIKNKKNESCLVLKDEYVVLENYKK